MVEHDPVWIVVLNWNRWRDTLNCLESLEAVSGVRAEILVVDNASTDGSPERIREYITQTTSQHSVQLIENSENLGYAGGMNTGLTYAMERGAQWMLLLNNDTKVAPDFLSKLMDATQSDERIGMLNPKIMLLDAPDRIWSVGGRINWMRTKGWHVGFDEMDNGQYDAPPVQDSAYTTGGCLLVRRKVIDDIGYMPEDYFVYYEDGDWSYRAQRKGWRTVVVPAAVIWHKGAASAKAGSASYIRYHVRNGLIFSRRTGNPIQIVAAYVWSIPRAVWQVLKWLLFPEKRMWATAILGGIADAWLGRSGKLN